MKYLFTLITLVFSTVTIAHDDHLLSDNAHAFYHVIFYGLLVLLAARLTWWGYKELRNRHK
ncbi:MAG: hypothetical protein CMI10_17920 [Oceanospirillaceae bacterium]|jgi:hypothetical protein|nr:hypothetical protein [Oceanospirillaceae bacterium]